VESFLAFSYDFPFLQHNILFIPPNQFVSADRALRTEKRKTQSGVSAQSAMFDLVKKIYKIGPKSTPNAFQSEVIVKTDMLFSF
jgi:hypothetical protein